MSIIKSGTTSTTAYQVEGNTNGDLVFQTNGTTTAMTIDTSQNVGIGTSSPSQKLEVAGAAKLTGTNLAIVPSTTTSAAYLVNTNAGGNFFLGIDNSTGGSFGAGAYGRILYSGGAYPMAFFTNDTERMRLDSSGRLGIGTTSPQATLHATGTIKVATGNAQGILALGEGNGTSVNCGIWRGAANAPTTDGNFLNLGGYDGIVFTTGAAVIGSQTERARISSDGILLVGKTTASLATAGVSIESNGTTACTVSGGQVLIANRNTNDGTIVSLRQDQNEEGSISVSGNTVSYNAFAGSHWSQLQDGSKPDILRGTVMESINELCVWPGEQNERLPKAKISDTAGSKKVYGVFMAWDNDWTTTNDMYVTAVGAFICRVNGSVTVQEGDLLESNGDGTARVQADDIIRSSTIGKVTSTVKTHQYDDGSYCVPTVLYCG